MISEDDFQRMLDAKPDDWQTRLVFADWLQDRDDPRAEGYRAIGVNRMYFCNRFAHGRKKWIPSQPASIFRRIHGCLAGPRQVPLDWFHLVEGSVASTGWVTFPNRRAAEEAAVRAFLRLPERRRTELLSGKAVAA